MFASALETWNPWEILSGDKQYSQGHQSSPAPASWGKHARQSAHAVKSSHIKNDWCAVRMHIITVPRLSTIA